MGKYGEPWEFEVYPDGDFAGEHGWGTLVTAGEDGIEVAGMVPPECGNRIVACVNFCAGYIIDPDGPTLAWVMTALENAQALICDELCLKELDKGDHFHECEDITAILAQFKKEGE